MRSRKDALTLTSFDPSDHCLEGFRRRDVSICEFPLVGCSVRLVLARGKNPRNERRVPTLCCHKARYEPEAKQSQVELSWTQYSPWSACEANTYVIGSVYNWMKWRRNSGSTRRHGVMGISGRSLHLHLREVIC